ncbi:copper homeostasis protein CutC [Clostridium sp. Cult2]|nr:copper homeostasis protein CutC [Clostridium sp. Cult2]
MEWAIIGTWKMALEGIEKAGAHRIELNNAMYLGGLTPSLGTIELVVENC